MKKHIAIFLVMVFCCGISASVAFGQHAIFDDKMLLDGYAEKYKEEPLDIIVAMIRDESLSSYKVAAAVRVFRENFSKEVFARQKKIIEKSLLRELARTDSKFVKVEITHTLLFMDRHKYFKSMIPFLVQMLDHYNDAVSDLAYDSLDEIIKSGYNRPREARIIFKNLRRGLNNSQKLKNISEPGHPLQNKLHLLRWAIKVLGNQELKRLPSEIINLL